MSINNVKKSIRKLIKINISELHPTQLCVGFAEVESRKKEFKLMPENEIIKYLQSKPIPLIMNKKNTSWMLDRHHRLKALIEISNNIYCFGYLYEYINSNSDSETLDILFKKSLLHLYDERGNGPLTTSSLPNSLHALKDDPFRSLVWLLKQEGLISSRPKIPFNEFQWSRWLRKRPLPPFCSSNLNPALKSARKYVLSNGASHLPGWIGKRN